ncbi:MAG TPA: hypothetical protein VLM40_19445 [Gemmata sp.]|nr:hypothetical protein [Gemmata sp.]
MPVPGRGSTTNAAPAAEQENVSLGWAEEEDKPARKSLSPIVVIGVALILMVTVYIGATKLMSH